MDKVLNLSAFGDIIENPYKQDGGENDVTFHSFMKNKPASHETSTDSIHSVNCVAREALCHSAQIKLLHWQTHSFAEHKALDELFGGFLELTDSLVESVMGKYGRPVLDKEMSTLSVVNYSNPESPDGLKIYMGKLKECYSVKCKSVFTAEKDPEILNIIDEIIALIDKTTYLLTLK